MLIIIIIICGKFEESIDHIVSVCLVLAKKEYIYRITRQQRTFIGRSAEVMKSRQMSMSGMKNSQKR